MFSFILPIFFIVSFILPTSSAFGGLNGEVIGQAIEGQVYNPMLKRRLTQPFVVMAAIDGESQEQILIFGVETGLGPAIVMVTYTPEVKKVMQLAVSKAIKWSKVAKVNKVDTRKGLACLGIQSKWCRTNGRAQHEGQVGLAFQSTGGGKHSELVVSIISDGNQFNKSTLHFGIPEMKKLLKNIGKIDATFVKVTKMVKKGNLFK